MRALMDLLLGRGWNNLLCLDDENHTWDLGGKSNFLLVDPNILGPSNAHVFVLKFFTSA